MLPLYSLTQMLFNDDQHGTPRASRIFLPRNVTASTEFWMGGARSARGEDLLVDQLEGAWVVDCARDMPLGHLQAAALSLHRVFLDSENLPSNYDRITSLAASIAGAVLGHSAGNEPWEHPSDAPQRVYVMCTYGLNRSGLVMGRILRALGVPGDEAIRVIREARPGALANLTYERIVRE